MEEIFSFLALLMTALGLVSLAVWFFCSAVLSLTKTRRRLKKDARHATLLKENERLRSFLAEAEEENARLKELCRYSKRASHARSGVRNVA